MKDGGWIPVAPSALAFDTGYPVPKALGVEEIGHIVDDFQGAAKRALRVGFDVVEIHAAHGYLLHEFASPLSNKRTDEYGGAFENRIRFGLLVTQAVREVWP